ncbi:MAG: hypothetical protein QOG11_90 [Solirubrobacteraceae bacterium]|nr:hypothetical protein [Solirubrobacteraceae bacterium]
MTISPAAEVAALVLTLVVHVIGAGVLIWAMLDPDEDGRRPGWRDWWPRDDDGRSPSDAEPPRGGGGQAVPVLSDSAAAQVRLREPGRLADAKPRPARRPEHVPAPEREREPASPRP